MIVTQLSSGGARPLLEGNIFDWANADLKKNHKFAGAVDRILTDQTLYPWEKEVGSCRDLPEDHFLSSGGGHRDWAERHDGEGCRESSYLHHGGISPGDSRQRSM